ncbi:MAG TPA: M28 family peptidase [Pyrinomonadaceae bacterium]|jgi:Zn-dependent M28 family amino/carboxypeptidase|nr:M28 family peptidase [Pyrinomonadaceae bacterium]
MTKILIALVVLASCAPTMPSQSQKNDGVKPASSPASSPGLNSKTVNAPQLLEDVRVLSQDAMEGRAMGTHGGVMARTLVISRFADLKLKTFGDSYEKPFEANKDGAKVKAANVVGYVEGSKHPDRFVVVTAHYDHLGVRDKQIYNGADDNASGVAVLLQLAAHYARERPQNSIIFAALDGEEQGLLGARALVKWLKEERRDVALDVNMDMVGHSERGELYASGAYHTASLAPVLKLIAERAPVRLLLGHDRPEQGHDDWTNQSDQYAFHKAGIPFVYFGVEDHKDYHKPSDDFDTITQPFFVHAAETILSAVEALDSDLDSLSRPAHDE